MKAIKLALSFIVGWTFFSGMILYYNIENDFKFLVGFLDYHDVEDEKVLEFVSSILDKSDSIGEHLFVVTAPVFATLIGRVAPMKGDAEVV